MFTHLSYQTPPPPVFLFKNTIIAPASSIAYKYDKNECEVTLPLTGSSAGADVFHTELLRRLDVLFVEPTSSTSEAVRLVAEPNLRAVRVANPSWVTINKKEKTVSYTCPSFMSIDINASIDAKKTILVNDGMVASFKNHQTGEALPNVVFSQSPLVIAPEIQKLMDSDYLTVDEFILMVVPKLVGGDRLYSHTPVEFDI